ncbi:Insulin gene enhancer protein isl-1 [Anabarilius grahami]|uniref:Insulin gene enhancer protein isl-1 n=1 Tax=Anabarilius grahami TaxID=495550 RepID=A0A3N0Y0G0_ANAGA|nr:Insulin gene enhancer protein isl-1 [Anabarilius grahami]
MCRLNVFAKHTFVVMGPPNLSSKCYPWGWVSEDPMLASPESQDSDMMISPPWKLLTDFILQKDAEHRSYQQLLSLSKEAPSAGSEAVSISAQLPDTPNSLVASATDISE